MILGTADTASCSYTVFISRSRSIYTTAMCVCQIRRMCFFGRRIISITNSHLVSISFNELMFKSITLHISRSIVTQKAEVMVYHSANLYAAVACVYTDSL